MEDRRTQYLVRAAIIAALYVALTFVFAPFSFREIQVRISEALTILPLFSPAAVPGLFVGCLLGNLLSGAPLPDVIFGSLATLLGAIGTRALRNASPWLGPLPPILANMLIIPFVLKYAYAVPMSVLLLMLTVGFGEVISCGVLGMLLYRAILPRKQAIFGIWYKE